MTESEGTSQEEQTLSTGSGVRSAVRTTNDVKYLPSHGGLSDTGQRVVCLREPRGAGEFRLTGHSGFSVSRVVFSENKGRSGAVRRSPGIVVSSRTLESCRSLAGARAVDGDRASRRLRSTSRSRSQQHWGSRRRSRRPEVMPCRGTRLGEHERPRCRQSGRARRPCRVGRR